MFINLECISFLVTRPKGYGLGLMVEIFCAILSGANHSTNVRRWGSTQEIANVGQVELFTKMMQRLDFED